MIAKNKRPAPTISLSFHHLSPTQNGFLPNIHCKLMYLQYLCKEIIKNGQTIGLG